MLPDPRPDPDGQSSEEFARRVREFEVSRAKIEQAKGILMARTGCLPDEAFDLLVCQSQYENRKLREIAAEMVASTIRRPATPPWMAEARDEPLERIERSSRSSPSLPA